MTSKTKINQLRWLAALLLLMAAMVMPSKAWAQTMYTVFDTETGTLTFKYDSSKPETSATQKVYDVSNSSQTPTWITNHGDSITKVVFDESFKNTRPETCYDWFNGCKQLTEIEHLDYLNTENVTNMSCMFRNCSSLTSLDVSKFNTQKVTNMYQMFYNCKNLQTIFVSDNFVTTAVGSSSNMFSGCTSIKGAIIYDPIKTDAKYANYNDGYFTKEGTVATPKGAYALYTEADNTLTFKYGEIPASVEDVSAVYNIPISSTAPGWNAHGSAIKKVVFDASFADVRPTTCYSWFNGCSALEEIEGIANLNTSEVTSMVDMFRGCSRLTSLDLSGFDTKKVGYMDDMFRNCENLQTIFVSDNFVTTAVGSSSKMFSGCTSIEGAIIYDPNKTDATYANYTDGYFTKEGTVATPKGAYAIYTVADNTLTFKCGVIPASEEGVSAVYKIPISSTTPGWNAHGSAIKKVVFDESFKNVRPETCYDWFNGCKQLTEIEHLDYLNTENVRSMRHMFKNCSSLTSLDVSNFNTQNVQLIEQMFYNCSSLTSLDVSNFDTQNVTYMESVFTGCSSLTSLNVSNFNTQKVTNMLEMFNNCSSLISLDLSNFNTQKVTYMSNMFYNCNRLKVIFVSENFTTTAVTSSTNMFYGCTNLKGAIAYNSGNSNNIKYANYTNGYFTNVSEKENVCFHAVYNSSSNTLTFKYGNRTKPDANETAYELNSGETAPGWINNNGITKVVFDYSFNYTQPTSCFQWFKGLSSLTTIEGIGYLNTSEVTTMKEMFSGCSNLASLQLKTFNTAKVTNMPRMFYNCSSLKTIYTSNLFDVSGVTVSDEMFTGCTSLVGAITYDAGKVTKDYANNETGYFTHEPEGEGTSESPFLIKTAKDLAWFRDHVNAGNRTACARLEADINMSSVCHAANTSEGVEELMWVPISDYSQVGTNSWYGTFDGNNKTISNLYINATANYSGLFGYLNNNVRGTIKNIKFENANINSTKERVAVLVGFTRRTDISGIMVNSGTVKGKAYCGGIAGEEDGSSISHCVNKADIEGTEGKVGGIVGYINSAITITNCANYGNVKGLWMVGGIAGRLPSSTLENVFTSGNVTYTNSSKRSALVVGSVDVNLTLSGYVIYNSDAKLYYKTNVQPTQAFDGSGSVTGEGNAIGLTADQLKNGWGTWLLNAEKAVGAWGQIIGTDDYPTLGGSPVYPQDAARNCIFTDFTGAFTNSASEATVTFTHGTPTYHPAVPNTCTDGNVEYYECNDCHRTYEDEAMTQLIEDVFLPRQHAHHDFGEDYICKNCSTAMPVVSLGDTDVTIDKTDDNDNQYGYNLFKYVADGTGTLYVKAYGDADTEGALWTALGSEVTAATYNDNENESETDFSLTYAVTQGETYIIGVRQKSKEAISGNYILRLRGSWTTTANREGLDPFFIVGDGTEASPYELSDASCLTWFANVVNGGKTTACAILTNDITFTGNFTAIGNSSSNPYTGTFDGKGHTVKVNQSGSADVALFGQIGACTIKNMKVTGTINTSEKFAAGFAMHKQGTGTGTIENCISDVVIESTVNGDGTHGGIIGVVDGGTLNINNCAVTGAIKGSSTSCCGGIVGWTNASSVINNTYVSATFTVSSDNSNIVSRNESKATATNCYYVDPLGGTVTGITQVNADDVTSGKLCMTINSGTYDGSKPFGQQLGTDNYPVPGSPYKLITTAYKKEDGTYWATFSDQTSDVTLSVPSNRTLKVYNATVSAGTMTLSERNDDNQVAKGEGVLLKTDGEYVNVKANESNGLSKVNYAYNNLVATPATAQTVTADDGYKLYRLTYNKVNSQEKLGFYLSLVKDENDTVVESSVGKQLKATPGKAYLKVASEQAASVPAGAAVRGFSFPGDDGGTTDIECITVTDDNLHINSNADDIYDLQGRKVSKPTKGVYIKNNKKVVF